MFIANYDFSFNKTQVCALAQNKSVNFDILSRKLLSMTIVQVIRLCYDFCLNLTRFVVNSKLEY